jgi:rubrerythrin
MGESKALLENMAIYEEIIMTLYWEYAALFPPHAAEWNALADEERNHASMIRNLARALEPEELANSAFNLFEADIKSATEKIEAELASCKAAGFTQKKAVDTAMAIEKSMAESRVFNSFNTQSMRIKKLLEILLRETKTHIQKITEMKI